jgi:hypothetical protein
MHRYECLCNLIVNIRQQHPDFIVSNKHHEFLYVCMSTRVYICTQSLYVYVRTHPQYLYSDLQNI